jgi:hypothetical protein
MQARLVLVSLLLISGSVALRAEDADQATGAMIQLDQPELPAPVEDGKPMEPDITIIRRGDETIEEHRIENRVYMIKVNPSLGPSYSWVDVDRDGTLDSLHGDNQKGMNINRWQIISW